jgi:acetyl-CoA acetyltransferase
MGVPVIVGVADIKNTSREGIEPLDLMLEAISAALKDTRLSAANRGALQSAIDSISVVANWTWPYPDTPQRIASRLKCNPTHLCESEHGGNAPVQLLDDTARRIALGEVKVAVVTGGEALASCLSHPPSIN